MNCANRSRRPAEKPESGSEEDRLAFGPERGERVSKLSNKLISQHLISLGEPNSAALPLDVRKASGFPIGCGKILHRGEAQPRRGEKRKQEVTCGKAEPYRTSGGKAAVSLSYCPYPGPRSTRPASAGVR